MVTIPKPAQVKKAIVYPSSDGEPLAETPVHVDAIIQAVVALHQYLAGQQAIVLADQFFYYAKGFPKLRVAPDVMVIENVAPGPRDNYKTWEEGSVPSVIFEMTSKATQKQDQEDKKTLYEQLEVPEYWLFDPKGEWIPEQLQGYQLEGDRYVPITNNLSAALGLRLQIEGSLIEFYRQDTGAKLLAPTELVEALRAETTARQDAEERAAQAEERATQAEARAEALAARLRELGIDPDEVEN
ncbi:MAG: Uma2 family endonuclease [Leptolyngbyaceae cyanobacterium]